MRNPLKKIPRRRRTSRWRRRLTGVATPFGGVSFDYTESERETVRKLLVFLEDRFVFSERAFDAHPERVISSIGKVSAEVTGTLQALPDSSAAVAPLLRIRSDLTSSHVLVRPDDLGYFLGYFRGVVGSQLAILAKQYDLEVREPLRHLLPDVDRAEAARAEAARAEAASAASPVLRHQTSEEYPHDLKYHPEHDWARIEGVEATCGITWYAQDSLGEIVHLELADLGSTISKDRPYGEIESVKAVSDLISPLSGEVIAVSEKAVDQPEIVNDDPYGEGWLIRIRMTEPSEANVLLDARAYKELLAEQ